MKSKPFHVVATLFAPVWEASEQYKGRKYGGGGRDLRAAKQWLELNPLDEIDPSDFQTEAQAYLQSKFEGAVDRNHPCYLFLDYYGSWTKKKREMRTATKRKCQIHKIEFDGNFCPKCYAPTEA
jgi:hypothetical protein